MRPITPALLAFLIMAMPATLQAEDRLFPKDLTVDRLELEQLGEYRYVYRLFFPLYEAALYTKRGDGSNEVLAAEAPFHLQFRYLREIEKSIILKSADKMLERNLSEEERASIADRVTKINQAYTSVQEGDRSSLTFIPGAGTTLRINEEPKVTIPGDDFARLYFQIWLGPKSISDSLRDSLLGAN